MLGSHCGALTHAVGSAIKVSMVPTSSYRSKDEGGRGKVELTNFVVSTSFDSLTFAGASVVAARRSNVDRHRHCPVDNHPFRDDRPRWEASPAEDGRVPLTSLPPGTTLDQLQQVASLFTTIFTTTFTVLLFRSPAHLHLHLLHHHLDPHHAQITLCSAVLVFYDLCMRLPVSHLAADRLPKQARQ